MITTKEKIKIYDLHQQKFMDLQSVDEYSEKEQKRIDREVFITDIKEGFDSNQKIKKLSSKYLYDDIGSKLFQDIMSMPEYYLMNCEYNILKENSPSLVQQFIKNANGIPINIIELGAGDAFKTHILLNEMVEQKADFTYVPIDISFKAISLLINRLKDTPFSIHALLGDYLLGLNWLKKQKASYNIVLFLGASIANFDIQSTIKFLNEIHASLNKEDLILLGLDFKKNTFKLIKAYSDANKITEQFNLNLLHRMNKEFNANFNVDNFYHYANFNPKLSCMESYLISSVEQIVHFKDFNFSASFSAEEPIHTESSFKYSEKTLQEICNFNLFEMLHNYKDKNNYFVDSLWKIK